MNKEIIYITRYAGSGFLNTVIGFVVIFCAMAVNFSPFISNIAGYSVGFILGFLLSKKFVFRSNGHYILESILYLVAFTISFLINLLVLYFALNYFYLNAVFAQIVSAISYTLMMYILLRLLVFPVKEPKRKVLDENC